MTHRETFSVVQQIETLFDGGSMTGLTDLQLLERFNLRRDARGEAAFAELVMRHGPMVLGVCQQLLDDRQHAEDAFQATFLVLARKARSIARSDWLGNWLYGVALRTARCARRRLARRRQREEVGFMTGADAHIAALPAAPSVTEAIMARDQARILHAEIARLPDVFRVPVVLCYLEGLSIHEAAQQLHLPHGTIRSRMARAREKLRRGLARRGIVVPAAALAALLDCRPLSAAASSALYSVTIQAALDFAASTAARGAVSASTAALAQEVLRSMLVHKLWFAALVAMLLGAVASGAGLLIRPPQAARTAVAGAQPGPASQPAPVTKPAAPPAAATTLRVVVLDPDGNPVSNAEIQSSIWTAETDFKQRHDYETDASGGALVDLPKTFTIVRFWTSKPPFVSMYTHWEEEELAAGKGIPERYEVWLERGVSAGGRILDENDKPIAGAEVQVKIEKAPKPTRGDAQTRYNGWLAQGNDAATTDAEGRWRIDRVPDRADLELSLLVTDPDHISDEHWGQAQRAGAITTAALFKGTAALKLKGGTIVRGRVTDSAGKPIEGAIVVRGDDPYFASTPSEFLTDVDGRFRLPALPPRQTALTVIAPGWAPQYRLVNVQAGLPAQDFRMERGKPIRLRVVDSAGNGVPGSHVSIRGWQGRQSLHNHDHPNVRDTKIPRGTDSHGVWEWLWAPEVPVELEIGAKGFAGQALALGGGAAERTIVLKAEHRVTGRVTDAVTGRPIPAFSVIPVDVFRNDWLCAEPNNSQAGKDGRLDFLATRTDIPILLRLEAMGYRAQDGPAFRLGDDGARTQDFRLQPSQPVTGLIIGAAGRPAPKVKVALATPTQDASLWSDSTNRTSYTDSSGRFAFPDPVEPWGIIARSDTGSAFAEFPAGHHDAGTLTLQPYATIRGQFRDRGTPVQGAQILLAIIRSGGSAQPKFDNDATARVTGPDGRFEFTGVPPLPMSLRVVLGPWNEETFRSGPHVPLALEPGQSVELELGGDGAVVTGKVALKGNVPADLDCNYSLNYLVRREQGITPPPEIAKLGFDVRSGWRDTWSETKEGLAYLSTLNYWFVKLAPDGSFRICGVPAGEYDLAVRVYAKPSGCLVDPLASVVTPVTVTAGDVARGRLELPEIRAKVVPIPSVGDQPPLRFACADGSGGSLADFRGSYTLVHFWASWCGPCAQQMPALRRLQERFAKRGLSLLGLSVDDDATAWREATNRFQLAWPQGRLPAPAETGVSSVPAYWLIDREGKIVSKAADLDGIAEQLDKRLQSSAP